MCIRDSHLAATSRVLKSLTSTVGFRGWVAVCGSGNEMDSPLRELRVDPGRELHEVEDLHLLGREFGVEGLHEDAVVVKLVAADGAEDLQDPFGRRGGAVPELGVEPDLGEVGPLHAGADLAFELTRRMSDARPVPTSDRSCSRWPAPHRRRTRPPAAASG